MLDLNKKVWQWLAMLSLALIWGSSFILMKKGLVAFSFTQVAAIRVFFGFVLLLPLIFRHFTKINSANLMYLITITKPHHLEGIKFCLSSPPASL